MKTQTENTASTTSLDLPAIQYWHNGIMMGLISLKAAKRKLQLGDAYIISKQAIGAMIDGQKRGQAYR